MSQGSNYSQLLRPIGQMLESLGVQSFILTVEGDDFSVRGQKPRENSKPNEVKSLRAIWQSSVDLKGVPYLHRVWWNSIMRRMTLSAWR